jgi:hypothetical protein
MMEWWNGWNVGRMEEKECHEFRVSELTG